MRLTGRDITRVGQATRVKLGIARTFQINRLFRRLSVLENVYIAVAERRRARRRRCSRRRAAAATWSTRRCACSRRSGCGDDAGRRIDELPYGRQRLVELAIALGLRPRVLLLDEPAAGVPSAESHIILDAIAALPPDIAVLVIDHDMDLVFRFARAITVLVSGAVFASGTPARDRRQRRRCGPSTWARGRVASALALEGVSAGYGETVVLEDVTLALAPGRERRA